MTTFWEREASNIVAFITLSLSIGAAAVACALIIGA